jgi:hypothetical protein
LAGVLCSLILLALLLAGSWLLLENPVIPPKPSDWTETCYTPWYYVSYLANVAALSCFGIELWVIQIHLLSLTFTHPDCGR